MKITEAQLVMMVDLMRSKALAFIFFVVGVLPPEEITGLRRRRLVIAWLESLIRVVMSGFISRVCLVYLYVRAAQG